MNGSATTALKSLLVVVDQRAEHVLWWTCLAVLRSTGGDGSNVRLGKKVGQLQP